jgi:ribosome-binding factor A
MGYRQERLASLIKEELSKIILREVEFPGSLVTIIGVEINKKSGRAIAGFSVLPSDNFNKVSKILTKNAPRLEYLLLKKVKIPIPHIVFRADHGPEKTARVEELLDKE